MRTQKIILSVCLIFLVGWSYAEGIVGTSLDGYWPAGPTFKVVNSGDTLFASHGGFLEIYDISEPLTPQPLGKVKLRGFIYDMQLKNGRLYLVEDYGLDIISLADLENPLVEKFVEIPGVDKRIAVNNEYAFVTNRDSGMSVIDIRNIENARIIKHYSDRSYYDIAIKNNHLFGSGISLKGVDVINIENPLEFQTINTIVDSINIYNLNIIDDKMFALSQDDAVHSGIFLFDLSIPSAPTFLSHFYTNYQPMEITVKDHYVLAADAEFGLHITNITEPENPAFVTYYDTPGISNSICHYANSVFIAGQRGGLQCLNIANINAINLYESISPEGPSLSIAVQDTIALSGAGHVQIINICDPVHPELISKFEETEYVVDIKVKGNQAVVSDQNSGIYLLNLSQPENPIKLSQFNPDEYCYDIEWIDDYVYVAAGSAVYILQINQENEFETLASLPMSFAVDIKYLNGYIYVVDRNNGLEIINVSDPENAEKVNAFDLLAGSVCIDIQDTKAYISGQQGLLVLDLLNNTEPEIIDYIDLPHYSYDIKIINNYVFTAEGTKGCVIVDVSNPHAMEIIGNYDTPYHARALDVTDSLIYLANDRNGLYFISYKEQSSSIVSERISAQYKLDQNYPNPFNMTTRLSYSIPSQQSVNLSIYDIQGRKIKTLINSLQTEGHYTAIWNGKDAFNKSMPTGLYFYRLQTGNNIKTKKMLLVK